MVKDYDRISFALSAGADSKRPKSSWLDRVGTVSAIVAEIDDHMNLASLGRSGTRHDLRDAIECLVAGQPVASAVTTAGRLPDLAATGVPASPATETTEASDNLL